MRHSNPSQTSGIAATRALRANKALAMGKLQQVINADRMAKMAATAKPKISGFCHFGEHTKCFVEGEAKVMVAGVGYVPCGCTECDHNV